MKILYGEQRPDEGTITVRGVEQSFKSPRDAIAVGIGMVHQHFMLADNLTVGENVILGDEPGSPFWIDFGKASDRITELGRIYGLDVKPEALVADLGVGDRQRVEILKVLYRGARILILDEPTAVLVPQEVDELFKSLRELTDRRCDGAVHHPQARRGARASPTPSPWFGPVARSRRCCRRT